MTFDYGYYYEVTYSEVPWKLLYNLNKDRSVQQLAQTRDGRVRGRCEYASMFSHRSSPPLQRALRDRGAESERRALSLNCLLPLIGSEGCPLAVDGCHVVSGQLACSGSRSSTSWC